jgi:hypothetical protein
MVGTERKPQLPVVLVQTGSGTGLIKKYII